MPRVARSSSNAIAAGSRNTYSAGQLRSVVPTIGQGFSTMQIFVGVSVGVGVTVTVTVGVGVGVAVTVGVGSGVKVNVGNGVGTIGEKVGSGVAPGSWIGPTMPMSLRPSTVEGLSTTLVVKASLSPAGECVGGGVGPVVPPHWALPSKSTSY